MLRRLLIANRGEIAVRVARTARRMGMHTIAVYSDADADALHVDACDEAFRAGGALPRESYLDAARILAIAHEARADAIHPGYGFLSENAAFATACGEAGIMFVGPPPSAIASMGSKSAAKRIMHRARVPLVPGYHGEDQSAELLACEAQAIGFPVLVKATAGGGGKGMKVAASASEFAAALASAQREARASFGDDRVLVEKYLDAPRHIEIQVFADTHGNVLHLFERDCSVQRRHQKLLEEAPAPGMTAERRRAMGAAAVAAAKAIGYVGAGTVEFIVEQDGRFFFMEMNTRLQVEHPVTEMITGLDLVEWQLRVAAGEPLPLQQDELAINGHAIEARLYAEDPQRDFLPSVGDIVHWQMPAQSREVRVDTGFRAGATVSPFYDPMLAKLIVHGADRDAALSRMQAALAHCEIVGVTTNVGFLERMIALPDFAGGNLDTGLIERNRDVLLVPHASPHSSAHPSASPPVRERPVQKALPLPPAEEDRGEGRSVLTQADEGSVEGYAIDAFPEVACADRALVVAAIAEWRGLHRHDAGGDDAYSPWNAIDAWWLNSSSHRITFEFDDDEGRHRVMLDPLPDDGVRVTTACGTCNVVVGRIDANRLTLMIDGVRIRATVVNQDAARNVFGDGLRHRFSCVDALAELQDDDDSGGHLRAPMSGTIVAVLVQPGATVARGAPLIVLEAMKMEHTVVATRDGKVHAVNCAVGDRVGEGADLVELAD